MKIILDCETTGLYVGADEILQLSIIDFDGNILFDEFIKPSRNSDWPEAQRIHGITPDDLKECLCIDVYLSKIQRIIDRCEIIIGYNPYFDLGFLHYAGVNHESKPVIDVMQLFAEIYGQWNDYFGDFQWQKLTTMADYYKYQWKDKAHNSLADCYATLFCYKQIQNSNELTNSESDTENSEGLPF